jgi:hypothetical protein
MSINLFSMKRSVRADLPTPPAEWVLLESVEDNSQERLTTKDDYTKLMHSVSIEEYGGH